MSPIRWYRSLAASSDGVATVLEYALLLGISLAMLLALCAGFSTFTAHARANAAATVAYNVALEISGAISDAAESCNASATRALDIPDMICDMPYLAYPSGDRKYICISLNYEGLRHEYRAPLRLKESGVRITGFITSPPGSHWVKFDPALRVVTLS